MPPDQDLPAAVKYAIERLRQLHPGCDVATTADSRKARMLAPFVVDASTGAVVKDRLHGISNPNLRVLPDGPIHFDTYEIDDDQIVERLRRYGRVAALPLQPRTLAPRVTGYFDAGGNLVAGGVALAVAGGDIAGGDDPDPLAAALPVYLHTVEIDATIPAALVAEEREQLQEAALALSNVVDETVSVEIYDRASAALERAALRYALAKLAETGESIGSARVLLQQLIDECGAT